MKKITAIILAVVVFAGGFGAGNLYRSICKAEAVTQDSTESDIEKEVIYNSDDQQGEKAGSYEVTETESETQSETVAVGLESTQISAEVKKSNSGTQLTDFDIIEQYPELPTGCEITAMTMELC